jgi:hypothetical protein
MSFTKSNQTGGIVRCHCACCMSLSDIPVGSTVCIKRDDGSDRTLLRSRPTNSRSDDAFVAPKTPIVGDERLVLLQTTSAEGTAFALVRTTNGVEGYVQSKYLVMAPAPAPAPASAPAPAPAPASPHAASASAHGGAKPFRPCRHQQHCKREDCLFHHFSPANSYIRPRASHAARALENCNVLASFSIGRRLQKQVVYPQSLQESR